MSDSAFSEKPSALPSNATTNEETDSSFENLESRSANSTSENVEYLPPMSFEPSKIVQIEKIRTISLLAAPIFKESKQGASINKERRYVIDKISQIARSNEEVELKVTAGEKKWGLALKSGELVFFLLALVVIILFDLIKIVQISAADATINPIVLWTLVAVLILLVPMFVITGVVLLKKESN